MIDLRIAAAALVAVALMACSSHPPAARSAETPPTAALLLGSEWVLERLGEDPVLDGVKPTLAFYEPGRIAGHASCNRYTGAATITPDGHLEVGLQAAMATTRMMCGPEAMAQEQRFLTALGLAGAMSLAGNRLTIRAATPGESLVFVRSK